MTASAETGCGKSGEIQSQCSLSIASFPSMPVSSGCCVWMRPRIQARGYSYRTEIPGHFHQSKSYSNVPNAGKDFPLEIFEKFLLYIAES